MYDNESTDIQSFVFKNINWLLILVTTFFTHIVHLIDWLSSRSEWVILENLLEEVSILKKPIHGKCISTLTPLQHEAV